MVLSLIRNKLKLQNQIYLKQNNETGDVTIG